MAAEIVEPTLASIDDFLVVEEGVDPFDSFVVSLSFLGLLGLLDFLGSLGSLGSLGLLGSLSLLGFLGSLSLLGFLGSLSLLTPFVDSNSMLSEPVCSSLSFLFFLDFFLCFFLSFFSFFFFFFSTFILCGRWCGW